MRKPLSTTLRMALVLTLIGFSSGLARAQDGGTTIASGFNGPQGLLVAPDGSVWVIDSGLGGDNQIETIDPTTGQKTTASYGDTTRVVRIARDGTQTVAASLPSVLVGQEATGGSRLALLNDTLYATNGVWIGAAAPAALPNTAAIMKIEGNQLSELAQTWPLERDQNPDGLVLESHPYGLTAGPDGNLWVADSGGNSLLKVDPGSGRIEVVAVFPGLPGPFPNPARAGNRQIDPVPTAVAFDKGGNIYVSLLPGAPFPAGAAKVVQVQAGGQITDYATGLSMVTDLRPGPDGQMYAVQFGQFTQQGPVPNSGSIVRIKPGGSSEVVLSGLSFPTSIDFTQTGDAYITVNGVGAPGSGAVVRYQGLTAWSGTPAPAAGAPAPVRLPNTGASPVEEHNSQVGLLAIGIGLLAAGIFVRKGRRRSTR